jgi:hypothetical protein
VTKPAWIRNAPRHGNDRLLLGSKGSLNEYELDRPVGYLFLVADCALRSACSAHAIATLLDMAERWRRLAKEAEGRGAVSEDEE